MIKPTPLTVKNKGDDTYIVITNNDVYFVKLTHTSLYLNFNIRNSKNLKNFEGDFSIKNLQTVFSILSFKDINYFFNMIKQKIIEERIQIYNSEKDNLLEIIIMLDFNGEDIEFVLPLQLSTDKGDMNDNDRNDKNDLKNIMDQYKELERSRDELQSKNSDYQENYKKINEAITELIQTNKDFIAKLNEIPNIIELKEDMKKIDSINNELTLINNELKVKLNETPNINDLDKKWIFILSNFNTYLTGKSKSQIGLSLNTNKSEKWYAEKCEGLKNTYYFKSFLGSYLTGFPDGKIVNCLCNKSEWGKWIYSNGRLTSYHHKTNLRAYPDITKGCDLTPNARTWEQWTTIDTIEDNILNE